MKTNFLNSRQLAPNGWTPDVCIGSPQRPCVPQYFNNYKDVGYRYNVITSTDFIDTASPFTFKFLKPFLLIAPYVQTSKVMASSNADDSAIYPWGTVGLDINLSNSNSRIMTKLFQEMQECTVDNLETLGVPVGLSVDEAVGYNAAGNGTNFNYYFNNWTNEKQVENKESFILPQQLIANFWLNAVVSALGNDEVISTLLPPFVEYLVQQSDLRLWGAPGIYTIDPSNPAPWVNDLDALLQSDWNVRPSIFIIEQKSIE